MINFPKILMIQWKRPPLVLAIYSILVSVSAFITALSIFLIPSDPKNNILLGLSLPRLILIGCLSLAGILMAGIAVRSHRDESWAKQVWRLLPGRGICWGAALIFALGWIVSFIPQYRFGIFQDYFARFHPIIIWLTFVSALTLGVAWVEKQGPYELNFSTMFHPYKKALGISLISMTIFALVWILIAWTGLGTRVSEDYWYGSGVPILGLQALLAFAMGVGVFFLEKSSIGIRLPAWSEFFIFALLWGLAAFLWAREPLRSSFFVTDPSPPNYEFYPYSDAANNFDLKSQFALIGQGVNNGVFLERPLYMVLLLLLHVLVGQDYSQVVALQAAMYAVFPAILYVLGKSIHSRSFGVILAVLATLRGLNGIAASAMIDLANQKQMMSDFPVAIFVAWFAVVVVKWLKSPGKNYPYTLWAGGIVGLAIMVRTHALFLLLIAIPLAAIVYWRRQKLHGLLISALLVVTMLVGLLPWGIRSGVSVFDVFMLRIQSVIQARYPSYPALPPTPAPTPQGNISPSLSLVGWEPETAANDSLVPLIPFESGVDSASFVETLPPIYADGGVVQAPFILTSVTTHFLHNVITSVFILPVSLVFHDLRYTVKEATPFWQQYWDGSMGMGIGFFLALNLLLIALGMGISWRSVGPSGLIPLGTFLFYNLANALARTSGGRYITPVDWVVFFYFALGLFQIILWGMNLFGLKDGVHIGEKPRDHTAEILWDWKPLRKTPWIILIFLLIGTSLPLSEKFFPRRYPVQSQAELLATLEREGYLQEMGFDRAALESVSAQWPAFRIVTGRALYPRYFIENKGFAKKTYPYQVMGFPRIAFTMIGPDGVGYVILPQSDVSYFPNASDVIVIGCQDGGNLDALAVVVIKEQTAVYVRQPASPLQCPLQQPVCDENHVCR